MDQKNDKKTVLLVDDAPSNIEAVNSILKDSYKIRIATNGAKALELVRVAPPRPRPARRIDARHGRV
jgi:phosphoserine phosphatase RsbU/P